MPRNLHVIMYTCTCSFENSNSTLLVLCSNRPHPMYSSPYKALRGIIGNVLCIPLVLLFYLFLPFFTQSMSYCSSRLQLALTCCTNLKLATNSPPISAIASKVTSNYVPLLNYLLLPLCFKNHQGCL